MPPFPTGGGWFDVQKAQIAINGTALSAGEARVIRLAMEYLR
jgi:hypothetical protein